MNRIIITFTLTVLAFLQKDMILAQNERVQVNCDTRLDTLVLDQAKNCMSLTPGFRVQITTNKSENEIDKVRQKFIQKFSNVETYLFYEAPNYILQAGNFESKKYALELLENMQDYPFSFVRAEMMYYY